ncbi:hypothetical protein AHAS_Ahas16G0096000 [Arachis hypogaea]
MHVRASHRKRLEAGGVRSNHEASLKGKAGEADTLGTDFIITEDMEVYLIRVVLQSAEHGLNWVVDGCFSEDEAKARQDAAFQMLDKVLTMTGRKISDYNFRKVGALQRRVEELEGQMSTPPYHRIWEL